MTDILTLARQAGFAVHAAPSINQKIQAFAALVRNAALEEAALKCEAMLDAEHICWLQDAKYGINQAAKKIRTLKEQSK